MGWSYFGDEPFKKRLSASMKDVSPCIGLAGSITTWFDNPTGIHIRGPEFTLTGNMRLEYISVFDAQYPPDQSKCKGMRCKTLPSSKGRADNKIYCDLTTFETFVDENTADITERYPSIERMNEYARIIGFLRWARRPGHLAGINLVALGKVPASGPRYRTPDVLLGSLLSDN